MEIGKLHYLPIFTCLWFMFTIILTYVISVVQKNVEPILPYISDTAAFSPASCIFRQLFNTGLFFLIIIMYIRYLELKKLDVQISKGLHDLNMISLILGWLTVLNYSILANFQISEALIVHVFGAIMAFGLGAVYQVLQARISSRTINECRITPCIVNLRWALAVISMVTFMINITLGGLSFLQFDGTDMTKWKKADGGYLLHLISAIAEWILVVGTITFYLTFSLDFRQLKLFEPKIQYLDCDNLIM